MRIIILFLSLVSASFVFSQTNSFEIIQEAVDLTQEKPVNYKVVWKIEDSNVAMEFDYSGSGESNLVFLPQNGNLYLYSKKTNTEGKNHYYKAETKEKESFAVYSSNETKNINGFLATKYFMKSSHKYIEIWFTEDINIDFKSISNVFNGTDFEGIGSELPSNGFILEYLTKQDGNITNSVSFVSSNSSSFSPATFQFPVGYSLFTGAK